MAWQVKMFSIKSEDWSSICGTQMVGESLHPQAILVSTCAPTPQVHPQTKQINTCKNKYM